LARASAGVESVCLAGQQQAASGDDEMGTQWWSRKHGVHEWPDARKRDRKVGHSGLLSALLLSGAWLGIRGFF
jgi:hypothetical protein